MYVRKAPYQFGWDWGPRYVTSGIWKKVALNFWNSAKLESVSYTQEKLNDKIYAIVPDAEIKDNNFASFMLTGKSHVNMNALINLQYK